MMENTMTAAEIEQNAREIIEAVAPAADDEDEQNIDKDNDDGRSDDARLTARAFRMMADAAKEWKRTHGKNEHCRITVKRVGIDGLVLEVVPEEE